MKSPIDISFQRTSLSIALLPANGFGSRESTIGKIPVEINKLFLQTRRCTQRLPSMTPQ